MPLLYGIFDELKDIFLLLCFSMIINVFFVFFICRFVDYSCKVWNNFCSENQESNSVLLVYVLGSVNILGVFMYFHLWGFLSPLFHGHDLRHMLVWDFGIKYTLLKALFFLPCQYTLCLNNRNILEMIHSLDFLELPRKDKYNNWACSRESGGEFCQNMNKKCRGEGGKRWQKYGMPWISEGKKIVF